MKNAIIALAVVLGTITIVLGIMLAVFVTKSDNYRLQLENEYKKNLYEFASNVNSLEVDLSKLIATNSIGSQKELLTNIYDTCRTGEVNLNGLPIASNKTVNISNYLNTTGGYVYSLLEKNLNQSEKLSPSDMENIEGLYDYCVKIKYDLNNYMAEIDNLNIIKQINFTNSELSGFDGGITQVNDNNSNLPALIYDGPFSESVLNKSVNGLGENLVSLDEAKQFVQQKFGYFDNYNVEYVGETNGKIETYNFEVFTNDLDFYVQITKRGGLLINITANKLANGTENHGVDECEIFAHNFASLFGIDDMYSVWTQDSGNYCYINLAPIVDKVIYYPDLIKVKVDKKLGMVVGWEATNYAYNHVNRDDFEMDISFEEGEERLSPLLTIKERNLCVIPEKYVGERCAYEYICTWNDYIYYVYIDPVSGEEIKVLRVVDTSSGDLIL